MLQIMLMLSTKVGHLTFVGWESLVLVLTYPLGVESIIVTIIFHKREPTRVLKFCKKIQLGFEVPIFTNLRAIGFQRWFSQI
jgi:hypothetical protein